MEDVKNVQLLPCLVRLAQLQSDNLDLPLMMIMQMLMTITNPPVAIVTRNLSTRPKQTAITT